MQCMPIYLGQPRAEKRSEEELPSFDFSLDYYEREVGFRVHISGQRLDSFDLRSYECACALDEPIFWPAAVRLC